MDVRSPWRLSMMMALFYSVQGAWWPILAVHLQDLGVDSRGRGWIFATFAIAAIATPFGAGQLADRLLPAQFLLAAIFAMSTLFLATIAVGPIASVGGLFALFLGYWLLTAPAYGLTSALALRNLPRPSEQFGSVRLWGTIGWMVIGWVVSGVVTVRNSLTQSSRGVPEAFVVAAVLAAVFGGYCLTLPNTPPLASGPRLGLDWRAAYELLRKRCVLVFLAISFGANLTAPFVYQTVPPYLEQVGLPRRWVSSAMTLSQVPEVISLALLPVFLRRFGYRGTMAIGLGALLIYFLIFTTGPGLHSALVVLPMYGLAVGCFIIAGQMYLDGQARSDRRATAQAMYVVTTTGAGSLLGNLLAGELVAVSGRVSWVVFVVPCLIDLAMLIWLLGWFRPTHRLSAASE